MNENSLTSQNDTTVVNISINSKNSFLNNIDYTYWNLIVSVLFLTFTEIFYALASGDTLAVPHTGRPQAASVGIFLFQIHVVFSIFGFYGKKTNNPWAYTIFHAIKPILIISYLLLSILAFINASNQNYDSGTRAFSGIGGASYIILTIFMTLSHCYEKQYAEEMKNKKN